MRIISRVKNCEAVTSSAKCLHNLASVSCHVQQLHVSGPIELPLKS